MTITLNQIADLHIDKWSGGMQHGDIQDYRRSTILKTRAICNTLLKIDMLQAKNSGDKSGNGLALATYELEVTKAEGLASADLTEFPISMDFNGGIHRVYPRKRDQGGFDFVRTFNPGVSIHTRSGNYFGYKYYWLQGKKICFRGAYVEPNEDMFVIVQMYVAAPDTIVPNDPLPIPPEFIEEILKRLDLLKQPTVPVDKTNNNNPQQ